MFVVAQVAVGGVELGLGKPFCGEAGLFFQLTLSGLERGFSWLDTTADGEPEIEFFVVDEQDFAASKTLEVQARSTRVDGDSEEVHGFSLARFFGVSSVELLHEFLGVSVADFSPVFAVFQLFQRRPSSVMGLAVATRLLGDLGDRLGKRFLDLPGMYLQVGRSLFFRQNMLEDLPGVIGVGDAYAEEQKGGNHGGNVLSGAAIARCVEDAASLGKRRPKKRILLCVDRPDELWDVVPGVGFIQREPGGDHLVAGEARTPGSKADKPKTMAGEPVTGLGILDGNGAGNVEKDVLFGLPSTEVRDHPDARGDFVDSLDVGWFESFVGTVLEVKEERFERAQLFFFRRR
jgi:hypothetical protein